MKQFILGAAAVSLGLVVFVMEADAQGVKEGNWNMTIVTQMEGMPDAAGEMQQAMADMSPEEKAMMQQMMGGMNLAVTGGGTGITTTVTQCITNENPVPESDAADEGCRQTHSISGPTVDFQTVCADSTSTGQVTYENDSMRGTIHSREMADGKETNVTIQITGQYAGPCT